MAELLVEPATYTKRPHCVCDSFAGFLEYQAEEAYPEGWQNNQYANPDAVRV